MIATTIGDNCFVVTDKIGVVKNVLRDVTHDVCTGFIVFEEFENVESFFEEPLDSKTVSVFYVNKLSGTRVVYAVADVKTKCVMLPYKQGFVVIPQLHFS